MRHVIGIVAHFKRRDYVNALERQLSPQVVSWDDGFRGPGGNHVDTLSALYDHDPNSWLVVLEDDAVPVVDFHTQLRLALCVAPRPIVSLYLGTGYPAEYQRSFADAIDRFENVCWFEHAQMRHAVGYAVHPSIAPALINRMGQLVEQRFAPDDAITGYLRGTGQLCAYANPSLVDHRDDGTILDVRMHLGHPQAPGRKLPRKAHKVGTRRTWSDTSYIVKPL